MRAHVTPPLHLLFSYALLCMCRSTSSLLLLASLHVPTTSSPLFFSFLRPHLFTSSLLLFVSLHVTHAPTLPLHLFSTSSHDRFFACGRPFDDPTSSLPLLFSWSLPSAHGSRPLFSSPPSACTCSRTAAVRSVVNKPHGHHQLRRHQGRSGRVHEERLGQDVGGRRVVERLAQ